MRMQLAALSVFALVCCASSGAIARDAQCSWDAAIWNTAWAGPGATLTTAPLTLRVLNPMGEVEGAWGDPVEGEVWGRLVGPDSNTLIGEWGRSREFGAEGGFLLQISRPLKAGDGCRFEGVYTLSDGGPYGWFGDLSDIQ